LKKKQILLATVKSLVVVTVFWSIAYWVSGYAAAATVFTALFILFGLIGVLIT
jgi:hypothetical protein